MKSQIEKNLKKYYHDSDDGVDYTVDEENEVEKAEQVLFGNDFEKAEFSEKERKKLVKKKEAEPDGSYPIRNVSDLKNAIQAIGRSKNPEKTKRWIKKRAKELNKEELLPETWKAEKTDLQKAEDLLLSK